MNETGHDDDLQQDIAEEESLARELSSLFGEGIVEQARLLDVADLNLTNDMASAIADGIKQLKQDRNNLAAQKRWLEKQEPGLQLLLCLWIMDMGLLDKIQSSSWL